jgi:hypothetical protein
MWIRKTVFAVKSSKYIDINAVFNSNVCRLQVNLQTLSIRRITSVNVTIIVKAFRSILKIWVSPSKDNVQVQRESRTRLMVQSQ